jgi:hypothetical protein
MFDERNARLPQIERLKDHLSPVITHNKGDSLILAQQGDFIAVMPEDLARVKAAILEFEKSLKK